MSYSAWAAAAAVALSVLGMMFVIAGVLTAGLFLPGVVLIGISLAAYAAAAVLQLREPVTAQGATTSRERGSH